MTLTSRLDAKNGTSENERICENGETSVLIALAALIVNVSIIHYAALLRKRLGLHSIHE